jgi:hypothetical protein
VREHNHIGVHTSSLRLNEDVVGMPLNMHLSGAKRDVFYRFRDLDNRHVVEGGRNNFYTGLGVTGRQKHSGQESNAAERWAYGEDTVTHTPHSRPKRAFEGMSTLEKNAAGDKKDERLVNDASRRIQFTKRPVG